MALVLKDRVLENSTSSGTGSFTLSGAQTGFQSFSVIGNGNTTYYTIQGKNSDGTLTGEWEVGVGTYNAGVLARNTVLESSNSNALVNFAVGLKDVFCDLPAEKVTPLPTGTSSQLLANDGSGGFSNVTIGSNLTYAGGTLSATGGMTYPGAGIANSTGSAWGTSYTTTGSGTVVALATGATFDNATIGSVTPGSGAFTYLSTSSSTSTTPVLSFNASNSGFAMGATISGNYLQTVLQNKSGTASASTNYVLSNNLGTDSTYYGEFGMNSSVYSSGTPADFFSLNNGVYFSSHDSDVTIGSGNGYKTYFAWGTTGDKAHVINASGAIGLNTSITGSTNFGTSGQVLTSAGSSATPTWTTPTTGTVTSVTGTAPVVSSGGTTPAISMAAATTSVNGYLTSTDWTTFNNKQATLVSGTNIKTVNSTSLLGSGDVSVGVTSVTGTAPVVSSGGATPAISMPAATTSVSGYLSSTDWNTFNGKAPATSGTSILYGNGSGGFSNVTIGSGLTFSTGTLSASGGGGMTYPSGTGIAVVTGGASWGTTLTAPSGAVVGTTDTQTLTNKRVTPRVSTTTSSATPTINTDNVDMYGLTAQAVDITSFTTNLSGTPTDGQKLWIYIVGTAARAITWGGSFESSTATLPTTTVSTNRLDVGFVWNTATTKWRCVAVA